MPTSYTSLLGLALPVTGELSGTWGDTVNSYITQYVDAAVAGAQTISGSQTAVTLSVTNGASLTQAGSGSTGSAQYQIINCTGNPASALTVTVPSASKVYLVLNNTSTSQTVTVKGAATTGVTVAAARCALIAWNGTDFELVATDDASKMNGVLAAVNGGTGQSSYAVGDILYASTTTALSKLADVATGNALISGGVGVAPSYGKIGLTTHVSGTLPVANGGTNITSYTTGDILYASASGTLASLADVATGNAIISGGVGVAPSYGKIGLTTHVSGTLPTANGGTNLTSFTSGGAVYATSTSALTTGTLPVASGGTGVTTSTGSGSVVLSTSPTLTTPILGTPQSATLTNATGLPLTTGVTGTLPVANGGTGLSSTPANGALDIGNGTGFTRATLTAGSGVSISNGAGSITISATGSGGTVTSVGQTFTGGLISVSGSPVTGSGTLALTVAGTSGGIPYFSSASTWATSAALAANSLVIGGGAGVAPSTTTTGTGVLTALGTNVGSAGAFVVNGGALGTPSSGTLTNATGLPLTTGVTGTLPVGNGGTGTATAFTAGSVVFAGASGVYSQSNANFFWDNTNARLGIGITSPETKLHVSAGAGSGAAVFATVGNTAGGAQFGVDTNGQVIVGAYGTKNVYIGYNNNSTFVEVGRFDTAGAFRVKGAGTAGSTDAFQVSGSAPASSLAVTAAGYTQPKAYADTVVAAGNTGTALTLTCTNGNVFTATLTGNATITLSSPIATGATSITLILTNDATAGRTVAWAGGSFVFPGGAASLSRTTTANAVDVWVFFTPNGGTTWYGNIAMKNMTA